MPQIHILILGVALGYVRDEGGGNNSWRVLFPWDKCHTLGLYEYDLPASSFKFNGNFGQKDMHLDFTVNSASKTAAADQNFKDFVLDLTKPGVTHNTLTHRAKWREKGASVKIENATFHVLTFLEDPNKLEAFLTDGTTEIKLTKVAHTVFATIDLGAGEVLQITDVNGKNISTLQDDAFLVLDNDCYLSTHTRPDMEMLYDLVEDSTGKKFDVIGKPKAIPPLEKFKSASDAEKLITLQSLAMILQPQTGLHGNLADKKPCMFTVVTKPDDLVKTEG
jgi:hypothetical protein